MELYEFSKYIASVYRMSKKDFKQAIDELDVRATQSDLLMFIHDHPDFTQRQIARVMTIDPSLLVKDLRVLMQKGWVQKTPNPDDKRAYRIALTVTGETLAQRLKNTMTAWWADLFADNPQIDGNELGKQLHRTLTALEARNHD